MPTGEDVPTMAADSPDSHAERLGALAASQAQQALEDLRLAQLNAERACQHGAMVRRAGISKAGKVYAGWFCPADIRACWPDWADLGEIVSEALEAWVRGEK
jgi:hypothetical protein